MGKIMYKGEQFPGGPNVLSELRDINFSNVQDKQIILYDSTSRTWKNHTITAADVAYDENNSVEDVIDSLNSALTNIGNLLRIRTKIFTGQQIGANAAAAYADADIKNAMIVGYMFYGATSTKIVMQSIYSDAAGLHAVVKNMDSVTAPACNLTVYYIG